MAILVLISAEVGPQHHPDTVSLWDLLEIFHDERTSEYRALHPPSLRPATTMSSFFPAQQAQQAQPTLDLVAE